LAAGLRTDQLGGAYSAPSGLRPLAELRGWDPPKQRKGKERGRGGAGGGEGGNFESRFRVIEAPVRISHQRIIKNKDRRPEKKLEHPEEA